MDLYLIGGLIIAVIVLIFLYFLFIPLSLLISCAQSKLNPGAKSLWLLFMVFLWPIGSFVYGLFAPTKFFSKFISLICFVLTIFLIVGIWIAMPKILEKQADAITKTMAQLEQIGMSGSVPGARDTLQSALETMKEEMEESSFLDLTQIQINGDLHEVLERMIVDQELSPSELQSWLEKFRSRHLLDHEALQDFLAELRTE